MGQKKGLGRSVGPRRVLEKSWWITGSPARAYEALGGVYGAPGGTECLEGKLRLLIYSSFC